MMKKFIKDNRGQVLYAVIVTIMFMGVLSMIAMGLTLSNYRAALQKQQHVSDYYAADAAAEMLRLSDNISEDIDDIKSEWNVDITCEENVYIITSATATIQTKIVEHKFESWEVSYHAVETEQEPNQPS